jgi:hypothetical protein
MSETPLLGYLYVSRDEDNEISSATTFLEKCIPPIEPYLGDDVFWFGWNEGSIALPGKARLGSLKTDKRLDELSYLCIFSHGAEVTWQLRGNGQPALRLCLERKAESPPPPMNVGGWALSQQYSTFHCISSRRVLLGQSTSDAESDILMELRYPRFFNYPGIQCHRGERVVADVLEYLDTSTHRLVLVRYVSLGTTAVRR